MSSVVLTDPVVRPRSPVARRGVQRRHPIPYPHPPESMAGIPYYDDELQMAQSTAHIQTILYLAPLLNQVGAAAGLSWVSDNPVWYWLPEEGRQKALYPDYALTANPRLDRLTAPELVLALEVVSTATREKEEKDTLVMRDRNAWHGVREFVLIYPELDDPRSVVWQIYDPGTSRYEEASPAANGRYRSVGVPGLEVEELPPAEWTPGRKVRVWLDGQELRDRATEARLREAAEQRAEQERAEKEQERARAEQERARAEQERARAEQERMAREQEARRAAQLAERLRALGIDPDTV